MKLEKVHNTNGISYITIRSEYENEAIVIVTFGKNIVQQKGSHIIIKGDKNEGD